jgi:hypothetical protein
LPVGVVRTGSLLLETGSVARVITAGESSTLLVQDSCVWRAELQGGSLGRIATGLALVYYGNQNLDIPAWAGTLVAPNASVKIGSPGQISYGQILAREIALENGTLFFMVRLGKLMAPFSAGETYVNVPAKERHEESVISMHGGHYWLEGMTLVPGEFSLTDARGATLSYRMIGSDRLWMSSQHGYLRFIRGKHAGIVLHLERSGSF